MTNWVDVKDFGAVEDGTTDSVAAFEAADAAAGGREVLVPDGEFFLASSVTFESKVRFQGTVTMPTDKYLVLQQNFDFDHYAKAFGDEVLAFRKAFQALMSQSRHSVLDLCGRTIGMRGPVDMRAAVPDMAAFTSRRVIRNGQLNAISDAAWSTGAATSNATYATNNPSKLTGVTNVANIEVGSLVTGNGVGREVYVTSKDVDAQELTIAQPLYDAVGTQNYTFKRFRYVLDFSGFENVAQFYAEDLEIEGGGVASCIMLPPAGSDWHFRHCHFNEPKDRAITSIGLACEGMTIDRCRFVSNERSLNATQRSSVGLNINARGAKIRDNRCIKMGAWAVIGGSSHMILGNHWFHGDGLTNAPRVAGLILTEPNAKTVIHGNYCDNNFIEWTNEHDATPEFWGEQSFGALSLVGNVFTSLGAASDLSFLAIKPFGAGHFIDGLNVSGNTFKATNGDLECAAKLDESRARLNCTRFEDANWAGNTYDAVGQSDLESRCRH